MQLGPVCSRRALLPLPLLALPVPAFSAELTEMEARDALSKKVNAATAAGKGLDIERRGQFNEKALFSEDVGHVLARFV